MAEQDKGLTSRIGRIEIDWPQSIGYYGGVALATALGMIEPPVAIFIAAVPLFKLLNRPEAFRPVRFVGQVLEGASKPVGGDGSATVRLVDDNKPARNQLTAHQPGILEEARLIANRVKAK